MTSIHRAIHQAILGDRWREAIAHKAILRYPPEFDGELHIAISKTEGASTFDNVTISMTVASRKNESLNDVIRRVGREMAEQPLTIVKEWS